MRTQVLIIPFALYMVLTACKQNSAHDVGRASGADGNTEATQLGPANGGGGDPRVATFLSAASSACDWMQTESDLRAKASDCRTELADLTASLHDHKRVARVYSDDKPALDNGVPKDAVTDLQSRRIHINIKRWEADSSLEQQVTATMEITLLLGIPDRYNLGKRLTAELAASAAHVDPAQFESFLKWAYVYTDAVPQSTKELPEATILGQTVDHIPCALFITAHPKELKNIYLSLGVGPDVQNGTMDANNNYIGGLVGDKSDLQMEQNEIHFRQIDYETVGSEIDGSPIAAFSDRRLLVELTSDGQVTRVTGTSSRLDQPVICEMKK